MKNEPLTDESKLFKSAIDKFILEIDSLAESLPLVMNLTGNKIKSNTKKIDSFLNEHNPDKQEKILKIPVNNFNEFNDLVKQLSSSHAANNILPRTFIVSLISQYDSYLGELYKVLFKIHPELAHSLDKEFTFQEILKFKDLQELKEYVIEKDVETLLRESHFEQFKTLERKIKKLTGKDFLLTVDLPILSTFIEVTQRRNLFVHNGGIVSRQYLDVCNRFNVTNIANIKLGAQLKVDPLYFNEAYQAIFEVGTKLGQILWRKFVPNDIAEADKQLSLTCYDLLCGEYYDLVKTLLHFGTRTIKRHGSEQVRKIMVINYSLAYYLNGENEKANEILNCEDWSIGNEFKLAHAVIKEDYKEAKLLMIKIGANDEIFDKGSYQEFPLFKNFRDTDIFKTSFKEIFGEEYILKELPKKSLLELVNNVTRRQSNK